MSSRLSVSRPMPPFEIGDAVTAWRDGAHGGRIDGMRECSGEWFYDVYLDDGGRLEDVSEIDLQWA